MDEDPGTIWQSIYRKTKKIIGKSKRNCVKQSSHHLCHACICVTYHLVISVNGVSLYIFDSGINIKHQSLPV